MTETQLRELLKPLYPQVLGALVRRHRDLATCEDALQEALLVASAQWLGAEPPTEPRAWLLHVAHRRMVDLRRSSASRQAREASYAAFVPVDEQWAFAADGAHRAGHDDSLDLFFLCCQPALSAMSATALALKALGGLSTAEIARAFAVPEATLAQRLSRARTTLKQSGIEFELTAEEQRARLPHVMRVLYLIFNEGYATTGGAAVHRVDLADEAIRLARMLRQSMPEQPEVLGLLALMLLTDARRTARVGEAGELIALDQQNRASWNREQIREGQQLVELAFKQGAVGPYQVQAAIASLHDEASSTETTDWAQIGLLYDVLNQLTPGPLVRLNQAVAIAMAQGVEVGLQRLAVLEPELSDNHRFHAAKAHLLERAGRYDEALDAYRTAADRTPSLAERHHLLLRAQGLNEKRSFPSRP